MTEAIIPRKPKRVRTCGADALFLGVALLVAVMGAGCAGAQEADAPERVTPPAVTDQSLRPDAADQTAVRPRIQVKVEAEPGVQLETVGASKFIHHQGRRCYRLALQRQPELEGHLLYEVIVTSNGRVAGVEKMSSSASNLRLETCLEPALQRLRFEVPSGSTAMVRRLYIRLELRRDTFDPGKPPIDVQEP